jgi:GNAT superfamily N-acetyltransferase
MNRSIEKRSSILVRRTTLRDVEILVKLRNAMHEELRHRTKLELENGAREYRQFIREMTRKKRFIGFLAYDRKNPALAIGGGCVWLREVQPRPSKKIERYVPYVLSMYTEPAYRGKGVATAIMRETMRWSKVHGYSRMTLHASELGRPVYSKLGWKQSSEMQMRLK